MKLLHVGLFRDHCLGGDIVLQSGFHGNSKISCRTFDYRVEVEQSSVEDMNHSLLDHAKDVDAVIIGKGESLLPETLQTISSTGTKIGLWYGDVRPKPEPWLLNLLPHCDALFITSAGNRMQEIVDRGRPKKAVYFFNPINERLVHQWQLRQRSTSDRLLFSATRYSFAGPERRRVFEFVAGREDIRLIGSQKRVFKNGLLQRVNKWIAPAKLLRGDDYIDAIRSSAGGIAVSAVQDEYLYTSDRTTHFVAFGTPLIQWRFPGCEHLFQDKKEIMYVDSIDELECSIEQFKREPDRACDMAVRAQKRMLAHHNANQTSRLFMSVLFNDPVALPDWWPTIGEVIRS